MSLSFFRKFKDNPEITMKRRQERKENKGIKPTKRKGKEKTRKGKRTRLEMISLEKAFS